MSVINYQHPDIDSRLKLIDFAKAQPQTLLQETEAALTQAHAFLDKIESGDIDDAASTIDKFDVLSRAIYRPFGTLSHLNSVVSNDEIRQANNAILPKISEFGVRVGQSAKLYQLYKQLSEDIKDSQDIAKKRAVELALRSFDLSGVSLPDDKKAQFADVKGQLTVLSAQFSDNLLDATAAFALPLTQEQLSGLTPSGLALLKSAKDSYLAKHPDAVLPTDYVATLDVPMYFAVMQYADDRDLRETLYHAYNTRASDQATFEGQKDGQPTKFDNSPIMEQMLRLRVQMAELLGFDTFTEVSLATKMADSHEQIETLLTDLAKKARPFAEQDLADLQAFAKTLGIDKLEPWDTAYVSEKLKAQKYNLDSEKIRPYFALPNVLDGLFSIIKTLFGVYFVAKDVSTWHSDVQFFEVKNVADDRLLGGCYIDLYARSGKRGGAWLSDFQSKNITLDGQETLPVCFIVGNFSPAVDGKPSLLTHDEALTLFHEFGHGLHHLLTKVTVGDVAGISGVEWDAVELPSQFMENFAWDEAGIALISRHIDTGEKLPQALLDAMLAARNFQSGLMTLRQLELALFDLRLHSANVDNYAQSLEILDQVRQEIAVIIPPKNNRFANGFGHIFSSGDAAGYAAGYYSYKWAEVLSADAFGVFEEDAGRSEYGVLNPVVGQRFYDNILAMGGSRTAQENFAGFAGRDAKIDALLRHSGFAA